MLMQFIATFARQIVISEWILKLVMLPDLEERGADV